MTASEALRELQATLNDLRRRALEGNTVVDMSAVLTVLGKAMALDREGASGEAVEVITHIARIAHSEDATDIESTALNNLACIVKRRGDPRRAVEHLERAAECEGGIAEASPSTLSNLAAAYSALALHPEAAAVAHRAVLRARGTRPDTEAVAHHNLAVALENAGERVTACSSYETALALLPVDHPGRGKIDAALAGLRAELAAEEEHKLAALQSGADAEVQQRRREEAQWSAAVSKPGTAPASTPGLGSTMGTVRSHASPPPTAPSFARRTVRQTAAVASKMLPGTGSKRAKAPGRALPPLPQASRPRPGEADSAALYLALVKRGAPLPNIPGALTAASRPAEPVELGSSGHLVNSVLSGSGGELSVTSEPFQPGRGAVSWTPQPGRLRPASDKHRSSSFGGHLALAERPGWNGSTVCTSLINPMPAIISIHSDPALDGKSPARSRGAAASPTATGARNFRPIAEHLRYKETTRRAAVQNARKADLRAMRREMDRCTIEAAEETARAAIVAAQDRSWHLTAVWMRGKHVIVLGGRECEAEDRAVRDAIEQEQEDATTNILTPFVQQLRALAAEEEERRYQVSDEDARRADIISAAATAEALHCTRTALQPTNRGLATSLAVWVLEPHVGAAVATSMVRPAMRGSLFVDERYATFGPPRNVREEQRTLRLQREQQQEAIRRLAASHE